jgi:hypothetical protein
LVGEVKNKCVRVSYILVAVDDTWGDDNGDGVCLSDEESAGPSGLSGSVFPESELIFAVLETE